MFGELKLWLQQPGAIQERSCPQAGLSFSGFNTPCQHSAMFALLEGPAQQNTHRERTRNRHVLCIWFAGPTLGLPVEDLQLYAEDEYYCRKGSKQVPLRKNGWLLALA
jgi:hypothetical protein